MCTPIEVYTLIHRAVHKYHVFFYFCASHTWKTRNSKKNRYFICKSPHRVQNIVILQPTSYQREHYSNVCDAVAIYACATSSVSSRTLREIFIFADERQKNDINSIFKTEITWDNISPKIQENFTTWWFNQYFTSIYPCCHENVLRLIE